MIFVDVSFGPMLNMTGTDPSYRTSVAFVQWEGLPTDYISYVLSARIDDNNVFGTALSPRFSVLLKPGEHLRASASIGTGFKAPDFRQLFVTFSNRLSGAGYDLLGASRIGVDLQPERSLSYDAGVRYEDGLRRLTAVSSIIYNAELRAFRNELSNLIEFYYVRTVGGRDVYSYRNVARAFTQGIESNLNLAFAHDEFGTLSMLAGYQFLDARDQQVVDAISMGQAGTAEGLLTTDAYGGLWGRSRHSGVLRFQYDDPSQVFSINTRFQFVGRFGVEALDKNGIVISDPPRKVLDRDDEYVAGYTVMNVAVSYKTQVLGLQSTFGIGLLNGFDVSDPMMIPGLVGRQFTAQAQVQF